MEDALTYNSVEQFLVQIYSMHLYFEASGIEINDIFHQIDAFLEHLHLSLLADGECVKTTDKGPHFVIPNEATQIEFTDDLTIQSKLETLKDALERGDVVKLAYKLPIGGYFDFRIIANADRTCAHVQHSWYKKKVVSEKWITLESIIEYVSELGTDNWKIAQRALFPNHSINDISIVNLVRPSWILTKMYIFNSRMQHRLTDDTERMELIEILGNHTEKVLREKLDSMKKRIFEAYWKKELGPLLSADDEKNDNLTEEDPLFVDDSTENKVNGINTELSTFQGKIAIGTAVGFVFTGAGITYGQEYNENESRIEKIKKIAAETASGGITTGIGAATKTLGGTVFDVGGIVALTSLILSSSYDSIRFARGKMTKIEYRKNTASNLGGAAGGLIAGLGTTLLVTFTVSNPVGWALALGAGAVGVVGGIAGAIGGRKIDKAIWDEGTDQVLHVHQFFGLPLLRHQNPIPIVEPKTLMELYDKKVKVSHDPPKRRNHFDWLKKCQALFMLLLRFMFPIYKILIDMTFEWKERFDSKTQFEREILQLFFDEIDH